MGKTTTIGKLSARLKNDANQTVLVAACDTFRWGGRKALLSPDVGGCNALTSEVMIGQGCCC